MAVAFRKRLVGELAGSHVDVSLSTAAPSLASLQRQAPPATPWNNVRNEQENMPLQKIANKDIKQIHTNQEK